MVEITHAVLKKIMPHCPNFHLWAEILTASLDAAKAQTVPRAAAFLAQIAHESGECRWLNELGDGAAYEWRRELGNTCAGDGQRFKGRGLIQLTGRANYQAAGEALELSLTLYPEDAAKPHIAGLIAAWYWKLHDCNTPADQYDLCEITRRINGGLHGLANRERYYLRALCALGKEGFSNGTDNGK